MRKSRILALALAAGALIATAALAQTYVTQNYMAPGGADWEVGGTLNVQSGGHLKINNTDKAAAIAALPTIAQGEVALSGTNPTAIATGLTTLTSCTATIKESAAPGLNTTTLTYATSGGTLDVYAWKPTSSTNPTLIASTGTETIGWNCSGS